MADIEYFAKLTRDSLALVKEVGAMPFLLFQYYRTWETAPEGIRPSLKTVCDDLGLKKNAVCNLKKILAEKGWIREENGQILLIKSFRKNEYHSEKMNKRSEKMNESFRKNERPYIRNEKINIEDTEKEKRTTNVVPKKTSVTVPEDFTVSDRMREWFDAKGFTFDREHETEKFLNYHTAKGTKHKDWQAAWRYWMQNVRQPQRAITKSSDDDANSIMSPNYKPKRENTFADAIMICYDIHKADPTLENYAVTKRDFLRLNPSKAAEVENYERSDLFRQRFCQSEPAEFGGDSATHRGGPVTAQSEMPVSP